MNKWKSTALVPLVLALMVLGGCTKRQRTEKPPETPAAALEQALPVKTSIPATWNKKSAQKKPTDWNELAAQAGQVDDGWLHAFADESLTSLVKEALQNNLNLQAVAANVDAAAARAVQAGAALKPTIGLGASRDRTSGGSIIDTTALAASVSWEVDLWGKLKSRAKAGGLAYDATVQDFRAARQALAAQVAKTWFLATQILRQQALAKESVELFNKMKGIAEARFEVGRVSRRDVNLASADLASAQERIRQLQSALEQAQRAIEVLLGRYPSAELEVAQDFAVLPPPIPAGVPAALLERRPDIVAAERRVAAAYLLVSEARAARLPSLSLTASGGGVSNDLKNLLGVNKGFFSAGANFLAPLATGGALEAQVDAAKAQRKAALAAYGQKALAAFSEVEGLLSNERLLAQRESFLLKAVEENEKALSLSRTQYEVGQIDMLAVLQIQARLIGSKSDLVAMRNDRLTNRVALHLALGGSFSRTS